MEDKALSKVKASTKKVVRVKDVGATAPPKSLWRNQKPHHGWKLDHEAFVSKMLHSRLREHLSVHIKHVSVQRQWETEVPHSPPWFPCSVLFFKVSTVSTQTVMSEVWVQPPCMETNTPMQWVILQPLKLVLKLPTHHEHWVMPEFSYCNYFPFFSHFPSYSLPFFFSCLPAALQGVYNG